MFSCSRLQCGTYAISFFYSITSNPVQRHRRTCGKCSFDTRIATFNPLVDRVMAQAPYPMAQWQGEFS